VNTLACPARTRARERSKKCDAPPTAHPADRVTHDKLKLLSLTTALAIGVGAWLGSPTPAAGFCGFYVAGADAKLFNDATMVVMMRDGQRTVLSMQNDYQGPPEDFALVIPVPVVLHEGDVKTLPREVFDHVDKLAAPRLVEYWEQDPCEARRQQLESRRRSREDEQYAEVASAAPGNHGVTIEAQFVVGEYEVVVLSAEDSTGLDTWLRDNQYNIPAGAEPVLRPYVEGGMKFFVAKVDAQKVEFQTAPDGTRRAMLSPLRFHYDTPDFSLPVRLGLINAQGPQDLLVHVLAPQSRYQVANYPNVTIPTNLVVKNEVREHFGQFYVSLFDHTLAQNPKAVVTEYAWSASSCDPCPEPPLSTEELIVLGADVLPRYAAGFDEQGKINQDHEAYWNIQSEFVLTRLHARYDKDTLGEDLVFEQAPGLTGGQGMPVNGELSTEVHTGGGWNSFQGRYTILHFWDGAVRCLRPLWDQWGGPPDGHATGKPKVAQQLAFEPRDANLASFVTLSAHADLKLAGEPPPDERPRHTKKAAEQAEKAAQGKSGCGCSVDVPAPIGGVAGLLGLGLLGLATRRRRVARDQH
jgi:MYXO-CTERM domain-containing protein